MSAHFKKPNLGQAPHDVALAQDEQRRRALLLLLHRIPAPLLLRHLHGSASEGAAVLKAKHSEGPKWCFGGILTERKFWQKFFQFRQKENVEFRQKQCISAERAYLGSLVVSAEIKLLRVSLSNFGFWQNDMNSLSEAH